MVQFDSRNLTDQHRRILFRTELYHAIGRSVRRRTLYCAHNETMEAWWIQYGKRTRFLLPVVVVVIRIRTALLPRADDVPH
jgi:hypothetical protein